MKNSWRVLQAAFDCPQDGVVGPEVLGKIVPCDFIEIKKKVDEEQRHIAEGTQANKRVTMMVQRKKKPTMEVAILGLLSLCRSSFSYYAFMAFRLDRAHFLAVQELSVKYGMSTARLDFFHDLFESFLPPEEALKRTLGGP